MQYEGMLRLEAEVRIDMCIDSPKQRERIIRYKVRGSDDYIYIDKNLNPVQKASSAGCQGRCYRCWPTGYPDTVDLYYDDVEELWFVVKPVEQITPQEWDALPQEWHELGKGDDS